MKHDPTQKNQSPKKRMGLLRLFLFIPLLISACSSDNNNQAVDASKMTVAGVVATAGNAQVTVSWTPVQGAVAYKVFYATDPQTLSSSSGAGNNLSANSYTQAGLTNGILYYFAVAALDNTGAQSSLSQTVSATPTASPLSPSNSAGGIGGGTGGTAGNGAGSSGSSGSIGNPGGGGGSGGQASGGTGGVDWSNFDLFPPKIISVYPLPNPFTPVYLSNLLTNGIMVLFDEPIRPNSITPASVSLSLMPSNSGTATPVATTDWAPPTAVTVANDSSITIGLKWMPPASFSPAAGAYYVVDVKGIRDMAGTMMTEDPAIPYEAGFFIAPTPAAGVDTVSPTVTNVFQGGSILPQGGASSTLVSRPDAIAVALDEAISPYFLSNLSNNTSSLVVRLASGGNPISGSLALDASLSAFPYPFVWGLDFLPATPTSMQNGTVYQIDIQNISDMSGEVIPNTGIVNLVIPSVYYFTYTGAVSPRTGPGSTPPPNVQNLMRTMNSGGSSGSGGSGGGGSGGSSGLRMIVEPKITF